MRINHLGKIEGMYIDFLQVRRQKTLLFSFWTGKRKASGGSAQIWQAKKFAYSGDVAPGSIKRLRRSVDILLQVSPERLIFNTAIKDWHPFTISFVTLTISDEVIRPHREVMKSCLEPMLRWLRGKGATSYIWKAELQARGQIHYHLTLNVFIHWQEIQNQWNKLQKKAGYLNTFARKEGHFRPNSTDVHAVHKLKDIEAYLCKYIVKSVVKESRKMALIAKMFEAGLPFVPQPIGKIDGKVWDCSKNLKVPYFSTEATPPNVIRMRAMGMEQGEFFAVTKHSPFGAVKILDRTQNAEWENWRKSIVI